MPIITISLHQNEQVGFGNYEDKVEYQNQLGFNFDENQVLQEIHVTLGMPHKAINMNPSASAADRALYKQLYENGTFFEKEITFKYEREADTDMFHINLNWVSNTPLDEYQTKIINDHIFTIARDSYFSTINHLNVIKHSAGIADQNLSHADGANCHFHLETNEEFYKIVNEWDQLEDNAQPVVIRFVIPGFAPAHQDDEGAGVDLVGDYSDSDSDGE